MSSATVYSTATLLELTALANHFLTTIRTMTNNSGTRRAVTASSSTSTTVRTRLLKSVAVMRYRKRATAPSSTFSRTLVFAVLKSFARSTTPVKDDRVSVGSTST